MHDFGQFLFLAAGAVGLFAYLSVAHWVDARTRDRQARDRLALLRRVAEQSPESAQLVVEQLRQEEAIARERECREARKARRNGMQAGADSRRSGDRLGCDVRNGSLEKGAGVDHRVDTAPGRRGGLRVRRAGQVERNPAEVTSWAPRYAAGGGFPHIAALEDEMKRPTTLITAVRSRPRLPARRLISPVEPHPAAGSEGAAHDARSMDTR